MLESIEFLPGDSCVGVTSFPGSGPGNGAESADEANTDPAASERQAQRALVELARAGNERALRQIYEQHEHQVRGHLFRLLGRDSELDDLVQIVFSRAFAALDRFEGKAAISTWLYRITVNTSHNLIRQRFRRDRMQRAVQWFEFGRGADRVAPSKVDARDEAQRILAHLQPDLRQIFVLYHHEGLTLQEISDIIERPLSTVGDRLTRARKQLRELVSQD
ncbi:RNA polymerase sigma-70 factor [Enhygromyxa salina]|uniref:RNA polymerase sigma-70 factor n=1 Tax=Enhygromyxa salina TaxID=215803 RepID=A0A0C2CVY3_9BACT|nr:RNA polymerase sigma factor [Enhygromyxa salina]KIG12037.1 RNA polymerase sigma-70 factor [Enhygromyxa salina]